MSNYPFTSESEKNYKALMGMYVSTWSSVEWGLYELIKMVYKLHKPNDKLKNGSIPLSKKIKLLRKLFRDLTVLQDEQEEMNAMIEFIESEQNFRHNLIHGVNAQIMKKEPWYTLMWRPEHTEDFPSKAEDVELITEELILEHYEKVNHFGLCLMGLKARLLEQYERENFS
ncbi:TPA: hypothetical protein ACF5BV_004809 [Vibrio parahaemolyticus]